MNINVRCPINNLGYGHCSRNILKALEDLECSPALFPIGKINAQNQDEGDLFQKCVNRQSFFDSRAPSLQIWHQFALGERVGNGLNIGLCFFELDKLKPNEVHHLKTLDLIWSASQWGTDVLINSGLDKEKIVTIPMGVDTEIFQPKVTEKKSDKYIFLSIGKTEYRKGHDFLHEIFAKAFDDGENVELWMMWNNPFLPEKERDEWVRYYTDILGDRVKFIPQVPTDAEVAQIIQASDCCILPTRAEGFGLPLLQALATSKPIITTNYSAPTEFCNKENSYLVDVDTDNLVEAFDGVWFFGDGQWADIGSPQKEQFIEHMKLCYKNRPTNSAGVKTAESLTWDSITRKFIEYLKKNQKTI